MNDCTAMLRLTKAFDYLRAYSHLDQAVAEMGRLWSISATYLRRFRLNHILNPRRSDFRNFHHLIKYLVDRLNLLDDDGGGGDAGLVLRFVVFRLVRLVLVVPRGVVLLVLHVDYTHGNDVVEIRGHDEADDEVEEQSGDFVFLGVELRIRASCEE